VLPVTCFNKAGHHYGIVIYIYIRDLINMIIELSRWCDENNPLTFARGARRLQDVLEELLNEKPPDHAKMEKARKAYGENLYFCRYQFCQNSSSDGFSTSTERKVHEERLHIKPHRCLIEGCTLATARPFTCKALLRKHISKYHTVAHDKTSAVDIEVHISIIPCAILELLSRLFCLSGGPRKCA
jgi:hypothetical protein